MPLSFAIFCASLHRSRTPGHMLEKEGGDILEKRFVWGGAGARV